MTTGGLQAWAVAVALDRDAQLALQAAAADVHKGGLGVGPRAQPLARQFLRVRGVLLLAPHGQFVTNAGTLPLAPGQRSTTRAAVRVRVRRLGLISLAR